MQINTWKIQENYQIFVLKTKIKDRYALIVAAAVITTNDNLFPFRFFFLQKKKKIIFDYVRSEYEKILNHREKPTYTKIKRKIKLNYIMVFRVNLVKITEIIFSMQWNNQIIVFHYKL